MNAPAPNRPAIWLAGLLLLATGALYFYYIPLMPDVLADHFGSTGNPNGWHDKTQHAVFYWGFAGLALFVGFAVPWLVHRVPVSLINLPNREYWLNDHRRKEALDALRDRMNWLGVAMLALMLLIHREVFLANLRPDQRIDNGALWVLLGSFALFMAGWLVALYRRFRLPGV